MPLLYVGRQVDLRCGSRFAWHDYLDEIGQRNFGRGKAKAYGSMAVSFVTANEMGKMLSAKLPHIFADKDAARIEQYYRQLAKAYRAFVAEQAQVVLEAYNAAVLHSPEVDWDNDKSTKLWANMLFDTSSQPQ